MGAFGPHSVGFFPPFSPFSAEISSLKSQITVSTDKCSTRRLIWCQKQKESLRFELNTDFFPPTQHEDMGLLWAQLCLSDLCPVILLTWRRYRKLSRHTLNYTFWALHRRAKHVCSIKRVRDTFVLTGDSKLKTGLQVPKRSPGQWVDKASSTTSHSR